MKQNIVKIMMVLTLFVGSASQAMENGASKGLWEGIKANIKDFIAITHSPATYKDTLSNLKGKYHSFDVFNLRLLEAVAARPRDVEGRSNGWDNANSEDRDRHVIDLASILDEGGEIDSDIMKLLPFELRSNNRDSFRKVHQTAATRFPCSDVLEDHPELDTVDLSKARKPSGYEKYHQEILKFAANQDHNDADSGCSDTDTMKYNGDADSKLDPLQPTAELDEPQLPVEPNGSYPADESPFEPKLRNGKLQADPPLYLTPDEISKRNEEIRELAERGEKIREEQAKNDQKLDRSMNKVDCIKKNLDPLCQGRKDNTRRLTDSCNRFDDLKNRTQRVADDIKQMQSWIFGTIAFASIAAVTLKLYDYLFLVSVKNQNALVLTELRKRLDKHENTNKVVTFFDAQSHRLTLFTAQDKDQLRTQLIQRSAKSEMLDTYLKGLDKRVTERRVQQSFWQRICGGVSRDWNALRTWFSTGPQAQAQ